ncbi:MAG: DUF1501 domain-containing protein [Gemmataceae bacterium]|nr:DUF1501 domain-containing protein [Gemmataceae bacterium]
MDPRIEAKLMINRREFFGRQALGMGTAALAGLLTRDGLAAGQQNKGLPGLPHFAPKAKNIIYLFQNGAPSHVELFDFKPKLVGMHGKPVPDSYFEGKRFSTMTGNPKGKVMLAPVEPFKQHGKSGAWVSSFMPHVASLADDLCFIKSMHTEAVNHAPAISFFLSGSQLPGRPSLGAWLSYGLGSEADNLPAFAVMTSISKGTTCGQIFYDFYWGSGFLPSQHQGVKFRSGADPVLYLSNPEGMSAPVRRGMLDDIAKLNEIKLKEFADPEIATRISQYEMAYRMQTSVPELTDFSKETEKTLALYGPGVKEPGTFAHHCLLARRLVERGTRCVQLMHAGWDQHRSITTELYTQCRDTDQPTAGLIRDLKQRGMLNDTLVIWGGEFGRTPFIQGDLGNRPQWGRDHHPYAFTLFMAGGGVKPGITYGGSDDLAMNVADKPVHVHDLQATLLHQMGIDHTKLTFKFQGRHFRLTDVFGKVVKDILA